MSGFKRAGKRGLVYAAPLLCLVFATYLVFNLGSDRDVLSPDENSELITEEQSEDDATLNGLLSSVEDAFSSEEQIASAHDQFLTDLSAHSSSATAEGSGVTAVAWEERTALPEAAKCVLQEYERSTGYTLASSGYLDLQGNVWGALIRGQGRTVDIAMITTEDDSLSSVHIVRVTGT